MIEPAPPVEAEDEAASSIQQGMGGAISKGIAATACAFILGWAALAIRESSPTRAWAAALRDVDSVRRREAARELGEPSRVDFEIAVPALIGATADSKLEVRAEAIGALGVLGSDSIRRASAAERDAIIGVVFATLDDPEAQVRASALGSISLLFHTIGRAIERGDSTPDRATRGKLVARIASMLDDPDAGVRIAAGACLGYLPDELGPIVPALVLAAARDGDERFWPRRGGAGATLRRARPVLSDVPWLIATLASPDDRLRFHAAVALSRLGPDASSAIPQLIAMLEGPPPGDGLRDPGQAAAEALGLIAPGTNNAGPVVEALDWARSANEGPRGQAAAEALRRFQTATRPPDRQPDLPVPSRPGRGAR